MVTCVADLLDDADGLMSHPSPLGGVLEVVVRVQVRAAHTRVGDADDRVGRLFDDGVRDLLDADVTGLVHEGGLHDLAFLQRGLKVADASACDESPGLPGRDRVQTGHRSDDCRPWIGSLFQHLRWRKHDDDLQVLSDLGEVMFSTGVDRDHTARADGDFGPLDVKLRPSAMNDIDLVGGMWMLMVSAINLQTVEAERHTWSTQELPVSFVGLGGQFIDSERLRTHQNS